MNIKGLNPSPILPVDPRPRVDAKSRAGNATDRDGNGRQESADQEPRRHLSPQEFDEALAALAEVPGLKANGLTVKVETKEDCRVILIVDSSGQVVRRLSEHQLWSATRDKDKKTGRILDKAM